jgi:hypothetical protein
MDHSFSSVTPVVRRVSRRLSQTFNQAAQDRKRVLLFPRPQSIKRRRASPLSIGFRAKTSRLGTAFTLARVRTGI